MPDDDVTGDLWEVVYDLDEGADRADIVRRLKQILARLGDREAMDASAANLGAGGKGSVPVQPLVSPKAEPQTPAQGPQRAPVRAPRAGLRRSGP
jgi:hypothetical protein